MLFRETQGAERAERPAVGEDKDQRVRRAHRSRSDRGAVGARDLDQGRDPRGVVVGPRTGAFVVAVRHQDDLVRRSPGYRHDLVHEGLDAVAREVGAEAVRLDLQPVRRELLAHERGRTCCPGGARHPVRIKTGELGRQLHRADPVEGRGQRRLWRRQRHGFVHAEGGRKERNPDEQPRASIQAAADRALERA